MGHKDFWISNEQYDPSAFCGIEVDSDRRKNKKEKEEQKKKEKYYPRQIE